MRKKKSQEILRQSHKVKKEIKKPKSRWVGKNWPRGKIGLRLQDNQIAEQYISMK